MVKKQKTQKIEKLRSMNKNIKKSIKKIESPSTEQTKIQQIVINSHKKIILANDLQTLCLEGIFNLKVLKGSIEILGSLLNQNSQQQRIKSINPFSYLTIQFLAYQDQEEYNDIDVDLQDYIQQNKYVLLINLEPQDYLNIKEDPSNIILIENQIFWNDKHISTVEGIKKELLYNQHLKLMISGQKNTGKTLFSIYFLNSLLSVVGEKQKIFYLETDLGQPSFGLPGFVSLFAFDKEQFQITNSHSDQKLVPLIQFFLGEFSPQNFVRQYLQSIQKCIEFFNDFSYNKQSFLNSPLIINTHGFLTNIGEILHYDICKITDPNFIFFLHEQNQQDISNQLEKNINNRLFKKRISFYQENLFDNNKKDFYPIEVHKFNNNKTELNYQKKLIRDNLLLNHITQQQQVSLKQNSAFAQLSSSQTFKSNICNFKFILLKGYDSDSFEVSSFQIHYLFDKFFKRLFKYQIHV